MEITSDLIATPPQEPFDEASPPMRIVKWKGKALKMPSLGQLLATEFTERKHLLYPWLREQESCMVYAGTGVGKSLFALSAAIAVAGNGSFLGWKAEERADGRPWRVLYIDGEMHIQDVQERARALLDAVPEVDRETACRQLSFLARQNQEPGVDFPLITEEDGMQFVAERVKRGNLDLVVLDNFSTLGEVEDENAASSFNAIQQFLLRLKTAGVATMLVHHAGKGGDFRGSSKLAATFESIIKLERPREETATGGEPPDIVHGEAQFRVRWDKVRAGGPGKTVRPILAKLTSAPGKAFGDPDRPAWEYEAGDLSRLDEIKRRLIKGEFAFQKEIADLFGVSKPMAKKYLDRGISLGMWTQDDIDRGISLGKMRRGKGQTNAPVQVVREAAGWELEEDPVEGESGSSDF